MISSKFHTLPWWLSTLIAVVTALSSTATRVGDFGTLFQECRYREAIEAIDPQAPDAALRKGLALIHLGRYDEAEVALGADEGQYDDNLVWTLDRLQGLAWVAEAKGEVDQALELMEKLLPIARRSFPDSENLNSANALAMVHSRYGRLAQRYGRNDLARTQFRAAIDVVSEAHMKLHELGVPHDENDPRMFASEATAGMAQLFAAEGDDRRAERTWRSIAARTDDPETLRGLISFHIAQGNEANARAPMSRLKSLAEAQPEHRRSLALALVDFGDDPDTALALAESAFEDGPDVFARDTLAWVLHRKGEHDRAAEILVEAIEVGVQDPLILFHAGMIAHARGENDEARRLLEQALAINPMFDPVAAQVARTTLGKAD